MDIKGLPDEEYYRFNVDGTIDNATFYEDLRQNLFGMAIVAGERRYWRRSEHSQEEVMPLVKVPVNNNPRMK